MTPLNAAAFACLLLQATLTAAHAVVTKPPPRQAGEASLAACGEAVQKKLQSDLAGPIENAVQKIDNDRRLPPVSVSGIRGTSSVLNISTFTELLVQFSDNQNIVATYTAGDVVSFHIDVVAHHKGYGNVSVIDLASDSVIGEPLFFWDDTINTTTTSVEKRWPLKLADFNVSIPDVSSRCSEAGVCALQWSWYAAYSNDQTYLSCVDFVVV